MHLTRFTDLSLRVLIYLTHNERKGLVTVTELAERFKWSRNHMVKVVHFMSTKNWVQTHRGRFGGLTLKMPRPNTRSATSFRFLRNRANSSTASSRTNAPLPNAASSAAFSTRPPATSTRASTRPRLRRSRTATKSGKSSPARTCSVPSPTPRRRRAASSSALWRSASPANSARPDSNASAALIAPKKPRQAPACGAFPFRRFRFFLTPTPGRTSPKRRRRPRASLRTRA